MGSEGSRRSSPVVVGLLLIIALLLAVIAGGVFFLLRTQRDTDVALQPPPASPTSEPQAPATPTENTETRTPASPRGESEPIARVRSNFGGVEVQLDAIDLRPNTLLMTFSAVNCAPCPETWVYYDGHLIDDAYVVDDTSQTRYDVIRGSDNRALVNGASGLLDSAGRLTFSVNFTPPPPGSVVNVFLPDTEPFVGIPLGSAASA